MVRAVRRACLAFALALAVALTLAPAALADGAAVEVDTVPGQIYDVDEDGILFKKSATEFAIKNRTTQAVTSISVGTEPTGGFLSPHGAILVRKKADTAAFQHIDEWRDGALVSLGTAVSNSLRVAGSYAQWSGDTGLSRRDLNTGSTTTIATDAAGTGNDVAANGDVAFWRDYGADEPNSVARWRSPGPAETLAVESTAPDGLRWHSDPRTDGTNVVWSDHSPTCCGRNYVGEIRGHGPSGAFTLLNTLRNSVPIPRWDYAVAGGWVAFTRGDKFSPERQIWVREPDGDEAQVTAAGEPYEIAALGPTGEVVYHEFGDAGPYFVWRPGVGSVAITSNDGAPHQEDRGYGNFSRSIGGRWYVAIGGSLRRVLLSESPNDGSHTSIDSGPEGGDNPSHATFEFSSDIPDATFECKLDQGDYEPCDSPETYSSLLHGQHTLAVRSLDPANDDRPDPDPAVAAWTVEDQPPTVTVEVPERTADPTPELSGIAGADPEDGTTVTVTIRKSFDPPWSAPLQTMEVTRSGDEWSASVESPLAWGSYTVQARQSDAAGNVGVSEPRTFMVDTIPPEIVLEVSPDPALTGSTVEFDAEGSYGPGGSELVRFEWDLDGDGDFERDTGATGHTSRQYAVARTIEAGLRVTNSAGGSTTERWTLVIAPRPPPGLPGVTINGGDKFTNDPDVTLSLVWPRGETDLFVSNDGGFAGAASRTLRPGVPWRLESSGLERLPKTVYVRFDPNGTTYQDDIILDETPPNVILAEIADVTAVRAAATRKRTYRLNVKGRDRTSGVNKMQITSNRKRPGPVRRYGNHPKFTTAGSKIFVRVRDRAANWSRWKRADR